MLELGKHSDALVWMDAKNGLFHIAKPEEIAKEWGKYRDVEAMTYDKMSRALRYYYRRQILDKTGGRMMYKFTAAVMKQVIEFREEEAARQNAAKRKRKGRNGRGSA